MNGYNKPQSSEFMQTYVSQHVPVPMALYMKGMEVRQENQDAAVAGMEAIAEHNRMTKGVATADEKYIKEINSKFEQKAEQLANTDLNTADAQGEMKSLVKGVSRDENLYKIKQNRAKYDQFLENKNDMLKAGKDIAPASMYAFQKSLAEYEKAGGYASDKTLADPNLKEHIKVRPIQEEYYNNIPESGSDSIFKMGETYGKTGWRGISAQLIHTTAGQQYMGYSRTSAAQQEREEYDMLKDQGQVPMVKDPKTGKPTPMGREEYVFNNFLTAGLERVGGISSTNEDAVRNADNKEKKAAANYTQHLLLREADPRFNGGIEPKFDEKHNLIGAGEGIFSDILHGKLFDRTTNLNAEQGAAWKKIIMAADANNISHEEAYRRFNKVQHIPVSTYTNAATAAKANADLFNRSLGSGAYKEFQVIDFESGEKGLNFTQYLKKQADAGNLKDAKGNPITMSDNPTGQEMREVMTAAGITALGETDPNYLTADGVAVSINGSTVILDRTYGGTYMDHVSRADQEAAFADEVSVYGVAQRPRLGTPQDGELVYKDIKDGVIKPYTPGSKKNYHINAQGRPVDE